MFSERPVTLFLKSSLHEIINIIKYGPGYPDVIRFFKVLGLIL